ncbi:hypothetical protein LAZ67_3003889 [Cordylochernes scorpioides]|uniref:Peptidase aspartic putative domain-containing protein n=1 Tax=Cordylochernes scorpioides TaxID=51811 RepID=A0ABY6K9F0_9ARAC|nr:hypothetical protein LAZ67_3003889 [Cordylochernes scorpioides]
MRGGGGHVGSTGFKMDKLKKACETKKRTLERVIAEADGELGKQEPSLEMLMSLRPKLLRCKDRFLIASDCLIEQLIKADREDEEIEDVDIVQANLFGRSEGVLQKMEQLLAKPTVDRESIVSGGNEGKSNLHRLPKLELPKFGGKAREWLQFWSAFQSVHDDDSISACVKFQYLQNCMIKGSVSEEIVSSFPNSAANYPLAISTLKERFGREDMLVEVYVRDLIAITLENAHGRNTTPFSTVYVRLSSQLRALGSLGVTTDKCAAILYPMVESALPEDLFVAWERTRHHHKPDEDGKHNSSEALLEKLMEFLKHENSYVLEQTASEVGLTMLGKKEVVHLLFGGVKSRPQQHKRYRIYISDVDSKYNCNFEVQDCSTICSAMPSAQPTEWMTELRSKGIDLDVYRSNTEIELLLGADVYAKLLTGKKIELESGPVALETKLGWTVSGKVLGNVQTTKSQSSVLSCLVRDATIQDLRRLDVISIMEPMKEKSKEEIAKDSSMQRMTEVRDDYFADALTNMQPHCEDLVSRLTDAIRGIAVPRAEEALISPFDGSYAASNFIQQLERTSEGPQDDATMQARLRTLLKGHPRRPWSDCLRPWSISTSWSYHLDLPLSLAVPVRESHHAPTTTTAQYIPRRLSRGWKLRELRTERESRFIEFIEGVLSAVRASVVGHSSGRGMAESMVVEGVLLWRGDRSWADLVLGEVGGSFISVVGDHFFRVTFHRFARKGVRARSHMIGHRMMCQCSAESGQEHPAYPTSSRELCFLKFTHYVFIVGAESKNGPNNFLPLSE